MNPSKNEWKDKFVRFFLLFGLIINNDVDDGGDGAHWKVWNKKLP